MKRLPKLTLVRLFVLTTVAVALAIGATFYGFLESSRRSIVQRSDRLRRGASWPVSLQAIASRSTVTTFGSSRRKSASGGRRCPREPDSRLAFEGIPRTIGAARRRRRVLPGDVPGSRELAGMGRGRRRPRGLLHGRPPRASASILRRHPDRDRDRARCRRLRPPAAASVARTRGLGDRAHAPLRLFGISRERPAPRDVRCDGGVSSAQRRRCARWQSTFR
jgi:hypothetical protein